MKRPQILDVLLSSNSNPSLLWGWWAWHFTLKFSSTDPKYKQKSLRRTELIAEDRGIPMADKLCMYPVIGARSTILVYWNFNSSPFVVFWSLHYLHGCVFDMDCGKEDNLAIWRHLHFVNLFIASPSLKSLLLIAAQTGYLWKLPLPKGNRF